MPMAARSAPVSPARCERADDHLVDAERDLSRIVLDPAGPRQDLLMLDLMPRDFGAVLVEHHEARAGRALIDGADVVQA